MYPIIYSNTNKLIQFFHGSGAVVSVALSHNNNNKHGSTQRHQASACGGDILLSLTMRIYTTSHRFNPARKFQQTHTKNDINNDNGSAMTIPKIAIATIASTTETVVMATTMTTTDVDDTATETTTT